MSVDLPFGSGLGVGIRTVSLFKINCTLPAPPSAFSLLALSMPALPVSSRVCTSAFDMELGFVSAIGKKRRRRKETC